MSSSAEALHVIGPECIDGMRRLRTIAECLFHGRMTPVGVVRAVEAWTAARRALAAVPKKSRQAHGHLIEYAPELICWQACRGLPLRTLHDARSSYPWDRVIEDEPPRWTMRAAGELIARYEAARPGRRSYKAEAPELDLWLRLTAANFR
ncbi:hypothetical protein [Streptomyces naphthomycinicus]|uniref:hypothetical protein n=1 Tax=Streptomyces naphthomycinicus TaxID=2872625 RepID=UPI001CEC3071|nr:hypothetical protein [Streptomyces sp. TML10]